MKAHDARAVIAQEMDAMGFRRSHWGFVTCSGGSIAVLVRDKVGMKPRSLKIKCSWKEDRITEAVREHFRPEDAA